MEGAAPRPHRSLQPSCLLLLDSLSAEDDERLALERFFLRPSVEGSGHSGAPLVGGAVPEPQLGLTVAEQITLSDGCLCGISLKLYTLPHYLSGRLHSHHAAGRTQWLRTVNSINL